MLLQGHLFQGVGRASTEELKKIAKRPKGLIIENGMGPNKLC